MKLSWWVPTLGTAAALLVGCGGGGDPEAGNKPPERLRPPRSISLTLDGLPSAENAGVLLADKLGYFKDAGIEITIYSPQTPTRPITYLNEGAIDVAISHEPQVALAQERGVPAVAIGSLVPQTTLSMIWLKESKIEGVADLEGKTISIPGVPFQRRFLEKVLAGAGLTLSDVKLRQPWYGLVPDLISGRADAVFGGSWNVEGAELEARGLEPVVTRAPDLGIPSYDELVVITRRDRLSEDPKLFRVFMAVVERGTAAAIEDPEAARDAIYETSFQTAHLKGTEAGLKATLPLLSEAGRVGPGQATDLIDWMDER